MKKFLAVLLICFTLFSMVACGDSIGGQNRNEVNFSGLPSVPSGNLFGEDTFDSNSAYVDNVTDVSSSSVPAKSEFNNIIAVSPFSEGRMLLRLENNVTYCVDKSGNIIFTANDKITSILESRFYNGYTFVNAENSQGKICTAVCSKNGEVIFPSDVGATEFYGPVEILRSGYILATKIVADYSSTKSQLGVLNTDFKWVVPPSESLYAQFESTLIDAYNEDFVINDCFYSNSLAKSLNLKTGEVKPVNLKDVTPSYKWGIGNNCGGYYRVERGMLVVQDGMYVELNDNVIRASSFCNETAAILYHNEDAGKYYITMINVNGSHLFEPIEVNVLSLYFKMVTDGNYLVYIDGENLVCLDQNGRKVGERDYLSIMSNCEKLMINDGVITIKGKVSGRSRILCFDTQLNKLF